MADTRGRHHISRQFDSELEDIHNRALVMGGLVEQQITDALQALVRGDVKACMTVIENDHRVNALEVGLDEDCTRILVRRQPTASDLRLVLTVLKTINDLERIGDQATTVARRALDLAEVERPRNQYIEIQRLGERVCQLLRNTLDAFARLDAEAALAVTREDAMIDMEYEGILRQQMTLMMEDPRTIRRSLDIIWSVRALERIGDHAKNICEYIIFLVKGKVVRHTSPEQMAQAVDTPRH
ncbi:MAG: phosphate signaling complex protein PhoU [Gammaproteobacteria bacterium]|nr:phosphate signaling complex protein PhoU [Gammaproteobacteria bacterium]